MARIEDLIAAVYSDPHDDTPRQVLGDHLLELGDSAGELIQVQCALAKMPAGDPRRQELLERERALVGRRWPTGTTLRFERGFAVVELEAPEIPWARTFLTIEPLVERLTITDCGGAAEPGWRHIGGLIAKMMTRVRVVRLEGVIWYWHGSDLVQTGSGEPEQIDETAACAEMLARLPTPPPYFVLDVPGWRVPVRWRGTASAS